MKVIINRAEWNVGFKRSRVSRLLQWNNGERFQCCLGFLANELGATDEQILDKHLPSVVVGEDIYWPDKMYCGVPNTDYHNRNVQWQDFFVYINDNKDMDNDIREGWIQIGFKELFGYDVEFVGKYPGD